MTYTTKMTPETRRARRAAKAEARRQHAAMMEASYTEAEAHVARGTCPDCGTPLIRNLALTGWWQCGAYATPSFRRPEHRDLPSCAFQCFTRN